MAMMSEARRSYGWAERGVALHSKGTAWKSAERQWQSINSRECLPEGKAEKDEKHFLKRRKTK